MHYRIGWPLWKLFASMGCEMLYRYEVCFDEESRRFTATSPDIPGLVVEGSSLGEIKEECSVASRELVWGMLHPSKEFLDKYPDPDVVTKDYGSIA